MSGSFVGKNQPNGLIKHLFLQFYWSTNQRKNILVDLSKLNNNDPKIDTLVEMYMDQKHAQKWA